LTFRPFTLDNTIIFSHMILSNLYNEVPLISRRMFNLLGEPASDKITNNYKQNKIKQLQTSSGHRQSLLMYYDHLSRSLPDPLMQEQGDI